jgi:hypothetical protein
MIAPSVALAEFKSRLAQAGFDDAQPDAALAWRVFKEFALVAVECADDALLFQTGTYAFSGEPSFHLDFTRQFTIEEDGEYVCMEQLHCTLHYAPSAELSELTWNLWSSSCPSLSDFCSQVEASAEFLTPTQHHKPLRAEIDQEEV